MAVVLVLACGIGLSVAMFAVADTVIRRPLPFLDQDRVVVLWGEAGGSMRTLPLAPQHFERFRREARTLQEVAGTLSIDSWVQPVRDGEQTFRVNLSPVTGNFFVVLGSKAVLGRTLVPDDDRTGAAPVAVLSYSLWRGQFAGNPAVLGRRLELRNSRIVTIVGVAAPGLEYPTGTEIWVPFANVSAVEVVPLGRLRPHATAREAAAELRASFERESKWRDLRAAAVPLPSLILGDVRPAFLLLTVAAAVLLLTACFNVSNLLLLRGAARQQEIAVRQALGASHGRIIRLLLVEGFPVALMGGLIGAWVANELVRALVALAPADIPRLEEVRLQGVPLGLAVLVGCTAALGSAVGPALWLSRDVPLIQRGGRTTTAPRKAVFAQRAMLVFQMGLAVFVLFVAGLLNRTLQTLNAIDTGLAVDHVAVVELSLPDRKFASGERVAAMYETLLPRIKALPGVTSVATVNVVPFTGATAGWDGPFVVERAEGQSSPALVFNFAVVGSEYFETLGIRLRSGRAFDRNDRRGSAPVAIVSEQAARLLGVENAAVGGRIRLGESGEWLTIIGVAADTRYRAIREAAPTVFLPLGQFSEVMTLITTLVIRTDGHPTAAVPSIRNAVAQTDPDVSVLHAAALSDLVRGQFAGPRLNAVLLSLFGAGAALLAAAGLYSLLAAAVKARRRELAIRQALGATPARLRRIVVVQGLWLCGAGLALGLAGGLASGRLLGTVLYGVAPNDVYTVLGVVVLLLMTSVIASYVPARRATRPDVIALLRDA